MDHAIPMAAGSARQLFVMAGQSNMQGIAANAHDLPRAPLDADIPFYWVCPESHSNGEWVTLQPQPGFFPTGHFGPEIQFARRLQAVGIQPAILKLSSSRSSLAIDWRTAGEGGLFDVLLGNIAHAVQAMRRKNVTLKAGAFVWIQGESDAACDAHASAYEASLRQLLALYREKVANVPILLGIDEGHPYCLERPAVAEAHRAIAQRLPKATFVSMAGLEKADETHLTARGVIEHGERLFNAYRALTLHAPM